MLFLRRVAPTAATFWRWIGAIAMAGLAIRVGFVVLVAGDRPIIGDAEAYYLYGQSIGAGRGMVTVQHGILLGEVTEPVPTAQLPPLFSYLLGLFNAVGITSVWAQKLAVAVVGSLTPVLLGGAGRELGRRIPAGASPAPAGASPAPAGASRGPVIGVVAAALAAVYPFLWVVDGSLMSETLYGVLLAGMLWVALHARHNPTVGWFVAGGALLGLAALARGEVLAVGGLVFAIIGIGVGGNWPRRVALVGAAAAMCVVMLVPWTVRNLMVFEEPVLIATNSNAVFVGANCAEVYRGELLGLWFFNCYGEAPPGDESQQAAEYRRRAVAYAQDNLDRLPVVMAARVGRVWGVFRPAQQADYDTLEGRVREVTIAGFMMYYPLLLTAIGGAVALARRDRIAAAALISVPLSVTLIAMAIYGSTRFRFSAEPALILLAAVGLTMGLAWLVRRRQTSLADPQGSALGSIV